MRASLQSRQTLTQLQYVVCAALLAACTASHAGPPCALVTDTPFPTMFGRPPSTRNGGNGYYTLTTDAAALATARTLLGTRQDPEYVFLAAWISAA